MGLIVPQHRTVAVAGASSGIGAAAARQFAAAGWSVCCGARRKDRLDTLVAELRDGGATAWAHPLDVTDAESVDRFFAAAEAEVGTIDAAVVNAGTAIPGTFADNTLAALHKVLDTNLYGALHVAHRAIQGLRALREGGEHRLGDIVFVSSDSVEKPYVNLLSYGASKAALEYFATGMRHELAQEGIRITVVRLGPTATEFGTDWEPEGVGPLMKAWKRHGVFPYTAVLDPTDVADAVVDAVSRPPGVETRVLSLGPAILPD